MKMAHAYNIEIGHAGKIWINASFDRRTVLWSRQPTLIAPAGDLTNCYATLTSHFHDGKNRRVPLDDDE